MTTKHGVTVNAPGRQTGPHDVAAIFGAQITLNESDTPGIYVCRIFPSGREVCIHHALEERGCGPMLKHFAAPAKGASSTGFSFCKKLTPAFESLFEAPKIRTQSLAAGI